MAHVLSFSLSLFFLSFSTAFSLSSNYFPFASRQRMEDNGSNVVSTWLSSGRKALGLSLPFSLRDLQGAESVVILTKFCPRWGPGGALCSASSLLALPVLCY